MKLSDIIVTEAIIPELGSATRDEAIEQLIKSLAQANAIPKRTVKEATMAVISRENQATTGIGKGVALPHAKLKSIKHPVGTIGRSSRGIDFGSLDSKPVYIIILLLSCTDNPDEHLQAMETIFDYVQQDIFRKFLLQSDTVEKIAELISEADELR
ncbi:MAG: PTS sugar transporter subunit IIA [Candidatus Zixiibacteriota bacterium]|nr:MAG: PTS sugar transporter subunit IIA [candidate division Zixibacteria bacterium]